MSDYPLLPSDRYLAHLLGITDEEYADFKAEARKRYREAPSPLVVNEVGALTIISLVLTAIGVGFTIAASFFKPRISKPGRPAQLKAETDRQEPINSVERYAPRVGFDAAQEIARIGQSIPLIYTKREQDSEGKLIGGIRITCPLIWSQIKSYGGNQLLRAIFLLGEGTITSIDPNNFAIGSNTIGSYQLSEAGDDARMTIYLKKGGGQSRLNDTHYLTGRPASTDPGRDPSGDVFAIDGESDFSAASKPTTQTVFGLYAPIGNNLGFRVNPVFRPGTQASLVPKGDDGDAKVKCDRDVIALSQREKYKAYFSTRSGLISGGVGTENAECTYKLFKSSDKDTDFSVASAASGWGVSVEVIVSDLFAMGLDEDVSLDDVKNLVSVTNPTVDVDNTTLTSTLTFNTDSATALFSNSKPGNYRFEYRVTYTNSEGLDEVEATKKWAVDIKVEQGDDSYEWQDNSSFTDGVWTYDPNTETVNQSTSSTLTVDGDIIVTKGDTTITYDGQGITSITGSTLSRSFSVTYNEADFHEELAGDVAATVSAKQRGWDDSLIVSELYKVGSAICVCTSREPADDVFQSEADFDGENPPDGKDLVVKFKTLRPGETQIYDAALLERDGNVPTAMSDRATGTNGPHIHRIALGEVSTSRECKKVEIGLKSVVGHRINGICNFKDTLSFAEVDQKACKSKKGKVVSRGETLKVSVYQSGVISCSVERISFFRISYRESGTTGDFTHINACFGIRGITQQNQFNSLLFTMPSEPSMKRWTFRFEPLSGWEVRNNKATATGPLYIVDSKLDSIQEVENVKFKGTLITRESGSFWINISKRSDLDLGLGYPDGDNYIDDWGKLAEQFIYEEVSSSTQGPEHEIVYINEIVENTTEPLYDYMAIIGLNIRSSTEWQQFSQFSCYVTGGINNTHFFPEILQDILTNDRYGLGHAITAQQIDTASFAAATTWCSERGYYFDGIISERQNIRQWAADVAATMLLIFGEVNGKFFLRPAIPFDGAEIKGMFTADNVVENTYQMEYFDSEDRLPIQVSIKYREERDSDSLDPGLFPTEREILIRETNYSSETDKIEPIDVSDYVTSRAHALDIAKFIIRMRRVSTHSIRFQTTFDGVTATLAPGDYIRCAIDSTYYDDFNNGVVDASGALTSTQSIADGDYRVFAWDGSGSTAPIETTLTVSGGGTTASPTGVIFSVQNVTTAIRTYQIESVGIEENGAITIEAVHMPTDEMAADWDGGWTIQE